MTRTRLARVAALALATVAVTTATTSTNVSIASADTASPPAAIDEWASRRAEPLTSTDPAAPLGDLEPLRRSIGDATIVALGESVHGAAEETSLKHRTLRMLVEQLGFRSVAWEEDWTTGRAIDAFIHGGPQDLSQLIASMSPQYQTREAADVLAWLRRFNDGRRDQVSFFGVEYYFTGRLAYDAIERYVATAAPDLLDELRRHLTPLRPTSDDPFEHIGTYSQLADKQPFLDHAHAVRDLVARVPHRRGDRGHDIALHAATQIESFHEHYAMPEADNLVYREARAAESLRWWQRLTGDRVVYWAASPHTANAPHLRLTRPGETDMRFASAGSHLRRSFGTSYLSIGYTFDHGAVAVSADETVDFAEPSAEWFEAPLGEVPHATFSLDLRDRSAPAAVRAWLHDPATTRGPGPGSTMDGGTLADWFDVLVHTQAVRPAGAGSTDT